MPEAYRDRNFSVYLTVDGVMEKAKEYCERYGYSLSKLGQIALIEKFEREREQKMVRQAQGLRPQRASGNTNSSRRNSVRSNQPNNNVVPMLEVLDPAE
jgi:hypothetical protein